MTTTQTKREKIPRDHGNDYTFEEAAARRAFLSEQTGVSLEHVSQYSFDPSILPGNVEHFTGVAQVPIGIAGPLLVDGEHAQGEFYVPLATAEGTLVASYNRGMKILREAGGVKTTILDDAMQRAPAFVFEDAREARAFGEWVTEHFAEIKQAAESTTRSGRLRGIEQYSASRILFTRFDYTTGDAAGQNLTSKATAAACAWIMSNYEGITSFHLESNFATDKKNSQVNILRTRGKRVVAEATIPAALIEEHMHTSAEKLFRARQVSNLGGFMSGVNNNGQHSANGIAALFIATGQDAANVAESSAALNFCRAAFQWRLLRLDHAAVADRRHLRGRHRAGHPTRVPGAARLLRRREGGQARRDRRGHRALRRALVGMGDHRRRVGPSARPLRPQPAVALRMSPMFTDVLCAVDGSEGGFVAVEQAAALAGSEGHLTLLLVTSPTSAEMRGPEIGSAQATRALERATQIAREAGVPSTVEVDPAPPPAQIILDWSTDRDLLAMGAPTTPLLRAMFTAGVADTALGSFTTPLFTARATPGAHQFAHRILVASDGRDRSDELVDLGRRLAQARGADMTLVHATGHESHTRRERIEEQQRRLQLTAGASEVAVEHGSAHDVIVATAESIGASLVVMGSRRLNGLRAIGSVSRRVVHEAPCSVLLVPPERLQG